MKFRATVPLVVCREEYLGGVRVLLLNGHVELDLGEEARQEALAHLPALHRLAQHLPNNKAPSHQFWGCQK